MSLQARYDRLVAADKSQPGVIAQQEIDDAQSQAAASQERINAAEANLSAAQQQGETARDDTERVGALESYTYVTAPLNGVVIWRYADTGALVQDGTRSDVQTLPLIKLAQSDLLRLRVPVPEDAVGYVHLGDDMRVRIDALHREFTGKVVRFTDNVSFDTRTMLTEVDVPNRNLSIVTGMYANTFIQLAHRENVLTIPISAVQGQGNDTTVSVLDPQNHLQTRKVTVGLRGSRLVEVTGGLNLGDRVLLEDASRYKQGEVLTPRMQPEPASDIMQEEGGMTDVQSSNESSGNSNSSGGSQ